MFVIFCPSCFPYLFYFGVYLFLSILTDTTDMTYMTDMTDMTDMADMKTPIDYCSKSSYCLNSGQGK